MENVEFHDTADLNSIAELLRSQPTEGAVLTELFLEQIGATPEDVSAATGRSFRMVVEYTELKERKMALRERVVWFAPVGEAV